MSLKLYMANKKFKKACIRKNKAGMEKACSKGVNINAPLFEGGASALIQCTRNSNTQSLIWLIEHDADLDLTDNEGNTALHIALDKNNADHAEWLLKANADTTIRNNKGRTALDEARSWDNYRLMERIKQIQQNNNNHTDLTGRVGPTVVKEENHNSSGLVFENNVNDNSAQDRKVQKPVTLSQGQSKQVMTVGSKKSPSRANKEFKKACNTNDIESMAKAFAKGADIDARFFNDNATALIRVAPDSNGNTALKWLIEHNANLDLVNSGGETALHRAANYGNTDNVDCLLRAGADTTKRNINGKTALDLAKEKDHINVVQLIGRAHHDKNSYKGFAKENDHTVSMIESLKLSGINLKKVFNFVTREVTTIADNGNSFQRFDEIHQQRLDEAAEALEALGGHTADWKTQRPGALAIQMRQK